MKKVLVLHFSQSGQLTEIISNLIQPIEGDFEVDNIFYEPKKDYPFPWTKFEFFNVMPETVLGEPVEIKNPNIPDKDYDLIILGYQPWFLSPSLPTTSLLKADWFQGVIKNKPVVTAVGARNMWINSNEKISGLITDLGGDHVGNIVLYDKSGNWVSGITIVHWMFTGKKTKKWGFFPKPGVSQEDINNVTEEGQLIKSYLSKDNWTDFQNEIVGLGKMEIPTTIWFIESRAKKLFKVWAELIKKKGTTPKKRKFWVTAYQYYLIIALFVISPFVLLIFNIFIRYFIFAKIKSEKSKILKLDL